MRCVKPCLLMVAALLITACASQDIGTTTALQKSRSSALPRGTVEDRYQQALTLMQSGRDSEAEAILVDLVKRHPRYTGPLTNLGIIAARGQEYEDAKRYFSKALSAKRDNMIALTWIAQVCQEMGESQMAEMWLERAIKLNPEQPDAYLNLAILYDTALERPRLALENYQKYLELTGNSDLPVAAWARDLQQQLEASRVAAAKSR